MVPLDLFILIIFLVAIVAGVLGALLGLGGALIVTPVLTLLFHVDIRLAIGASIISIIATSSGAASAYLSDHLANIKVATYLEIGTTVGALTGAFIAAFIAPRFLFLIFAAVLLYSSLIMLKTRRSYAAATPVHAGLRATLALDGSYHDAAERREISYSADHPLIGLGLMYVAGVMSALLGIGSGSLKVPALDVAMHLPIKVSTSTSNVMIGVTAAASAGVYFFRGDIDPFIAAPVAIGIFCGAIVGTRLLPKMERRTVRLLFVVILVVIAAEMAYQGIRG